MIISIIVPIYNSKETISKLIDSIENQTYNKYELILIDDGSHDGSYDYIKENYNNKKIKLYRKKNSGPGLTRKFGFEKATGDLIFFVDSDDWITDKYAFQKIINCFKENEDIDILFFDREELLDNTKKIFKGFKFLKKGKHKICDIDEVIVPGLGAKVFKKKLLDSDMFYNSNIFEDLYTTYLYLDKCKTFYYLNETLYTIFHDSNIDTLSSKIDFVKFENSLKVLMKTYYLVNSEALRSSLEYRIVSSFATYLRKPEFKRNVSKGIVDEVVDLLDSKKVYYFKPKKDKYNIADILKKMYIYFQIKKIKYLKIY